MNRAEKDTVNIRSVRLILKLVLELTKTDRDSFKIEVEKALNTLDTIGLAIVDSEMTKVHQAIWREGINET